MLEHAGRRGYFYIALLGNVEIKFGSVARMTVAARIRQLEAKHGGA